MSVGVVYATIDASKENSFDLDISGFLFLPVMDDGQQNPCWESDIEDILVNEFLEKTDILCKEVRIKGGIETNKNPVGEGRAVIKLKFRVPVEHRGNYGFPEEECKMIANLVWTTVWRTLVEHIVESHLEESVGPETSVVQLESKLVGLGSYELTLAYVVSVHRSVKEECILFFEHFNLSIDCANDPNAKLIIHRVPAKVRVVDLVDTCDSDYKFVRFTVTLEKPEDCWKMMEFLVQQGKHALYLCSDATIEIFSMRGSFLDQRRLRRGTILERCIGNLQKKEDFPLVRWLHNAINGRTSACRATSAPLCHILEYWCCDVIF